jgi:alkanesulfonate monooxygenase SsuD/methylene tetrahydromethanopterin reductase-like flavin-dependent oxidoreductase (luciferase family)
MTLKRRLAVTLPAGPKLTDTAARLKWEEVNGFSDAWFGDTGAPDSLTQIAALGASTSSIRIGVAVTPVYTRSPAVLAATANVIEQVILGRFVLGIGSSSQAVIVDL